MKEIFWVSYFLTAAAAKLLFLPKIPWYGSTTKIVRHLLYHFTTGFGMPLELHSTEFNNPRLLSGNIYMNFINILAWCLLFVRMFCYKTFNICVCALNCTLYMRTSDIDIYQVILLHCTPVSIFAIYSYFYWQLLKIYRYLSNIFSAVSFKYVYYFIIYMNK